MTVSEKLRLVRGLRSHAEMFGFNWNDDSDWTWHDVACKIADEIDAENAELRELCGELYHELYAARDEYWPASYLGDLEPRDVFPRYDELIELGVEM